jgi:hypothetical protein
MTTIYDALDDLGDLVLDCTTEAEAILTIKRYCEDNDLDESGFELQLDNEDFYVYIAEG